MYSRKVSQYFILVGLVMFTGCATSTLPPEEQKNYALIESKISDYGTDMDHNTYPCPPCAQTAFISLIDGKPRGFARPVVDLPPGNYKIQVGLGCGSTVTCHPSSPYTLNVEAGKRYVLKPNGVVYVSNRFSDRSHETLYKSENN
jgi:hypothetical protein